MSDPWVNGEPPDNGLHERCLDTIDQERADLNAARAERDEAVGLLELCQRHWGAPSIAAGDHVGPVARERAQTRERLRAFLARPRRS